MDNMGYTADNPPHYVRPLLEQYPELSVDSCGYQKGSWVEFNNTETGDSYKMERQITYAITFRKNGRRMGDIDPHMSSSSFSNVKERDVMIGEEVEDRLGGYDSFEEAVDAEF